MANQKDIFTTTDLATALNCTQQHIRNLQRKGLIPPPSAKPKAGFIWLRGELERAGIIPPSTSNR